MYLYSPTYICTQSSVTSIFARVPFTFIVFVFGRVGMLRNTYGCLCVWLCTYLVRKRYLSYELPFGRKRKGSKREISKLVMYITKLSLSTQTRYLHNRKEREREWKGKRNILKTDLCHWFVELIIDTWFTTTTLSCLYI